MEKISLTSFATKHENPNVRRHSAHAESSGSYGNGLLSQINPNSLKSLQSGMSEVFQTLGQNYSSIPTNGILPNLQIRDSSADNIYIEAELLLELIAKQSLSITMLSQQQKISLFLYFFKYNKKIGRIIDLFVNIPLSGIELRYPDTIENEIVKDYIQDFFGETWDDLNFKEKIIRAYRDYRLFGTAAMLVSDDYQFSTIIRNKNNEGHKKELVLDPNDIKNSMKLHAKSLTLDKDVQRDIEDLTAKYNKDKNSITLDSKQSVIYAFLPNLQGEEIVKLAEGEYWFEKYTGLKFIKNIDPYEALNRSHNPDINFYIYSLQPDTRLLRSFQGVEQQNLNQIVKMLTNLGYSKSYLTKFTEDSKTIDIDSYPFSDSDCWIAVLDNKSAYSERDKSILNRVISQAVDMEVVARANRTKSNRAYKKTTLYNVDATGENFRTIEGLIHSAMSSDDSTYIIANKSITHDDVSLDAREILNLDDISAKAEEDLIAGLGMTDSLVSNGTDSYANSYLKLELLTTEFINDRNVLGDFIENQIFKPVAIKKGFFYKDSWGKVKVIYPRVSFGRINLARNGEDFQLLLSLASEGKLPYTYILKALNFDPEEMKNLIENEQLSVFNSAIKDMVSNVFTQNPSFAKIILKDEGQVKKILKELNIEVTEGELKAFIISLTERVMTKEDVDDIVNAYQEANPTAPTPPDMADDTLEPEGIQNENIPDEIGDTTSVVPDAVQES